MGAGDVAQLGECLPSIRKALGLISTLSKPSMVVHTCNPSTQVEEQVGESETHGHPQLYKSLRPAWVIGDRDREDGGSEL